MHRSRLSVLVLLAAAATACSTRDDAESTELLAQDPTLVVRLEMERDTHQAALPDACGTVTIGASPAVANAARAETLARQAYDAEALGQVAEARSLLQRASALDGNDKSATYHLGRTSEALGDRAAAITAYCRYLALTPTTAEAVDARERVARLAQPAAKVAAEGTREGAPAPRHATTERRVTRRPPSVGARRVASATDAASSAAPERSTYAASAVQGRADETASPRESETGPPAGEGVTSGAAAGGEVVATTVGPPTADQPSTAARTASRGPSRVQRAGIGAAAGAIIGAVTGRSVKGAVIGAAAGGMLGTVMGSGMRPVGRGIRP